MNATTTLHEDRPIDFSDPAIQVCPYGAHDTLRAEQPVYKDPGTGFYLVLDPVLLRQVATDTRRYSSNTGLIQVRSGPLGERIQQIQREHGVSLVPVLLITDPPDHGFYRSLVDRAMSPARVKALETFLTGVVDEIIDPIIDRDRIDFVQEMAYLVPAHVVAALLGVPRDRVADIKRWSDASSGGNDPTLTDDEKLASVTLTCQLQRFLLDHAIAYRTEPNDSLLSALANIDVDGRRLTDSELVAISQQIIIAGHETTASAMASALLWIMRTPGLEARLRDDPALIGRFVEEVLRLEPPIQGMFRRTTEDVELAGVAIPAGAIVVLRWGAGNRDPAMFEDPGVLRLDRQNGNRHLTFGFGPHFCVGNQLARAELRIAFERLLQRMGNFRLIGEPERLAHYFLYGITRMEVAFDRLPATADA